MYLKVLRFNILQGLTLCVCGAADDVGKLGLEARVGRAVLARRLIAPRAQRQHALQRRVGPQTLALMDGQRRGVVDEKPSILEEDGMEKENEKKKKRIGND